MDQILLMVVSAALIVSGAAQVVMAIELKRIRLGLPLKEPDKFHHTSNNSPWFDGVHGSRCGYAIYAYRSGRWELEADLSAAGYEPSAPGLPGAYEGQVLKKESAPARGR